MMHSLHIIGSRGGGGAERFYSRLVTALAESRHRVTAVNPPHSAVSAELPAFIEQVHIPMRGPWDLRARQRIRQVIRRLQPDIAQTYLGRASRLTRLPRGTGCVHVARLGGYYDLKAYRHAHAWVGNTRGICDYLINAGLPADKVFHIGNFIDPAAPPDARESTALRRAMHIPDDARVVLFLGRLHPRKGVDDLLTAFSHLPASVHEQPLHLLIVGDGPARARLEHYAGELDLQARVHWAGWQSQVTPYYNLADVFICPSVHEPLGNVILEAWAHGVPVIATRTQGAAELITDEETGLLTPCSDPRALADILAEFLAADNAYRQRLGDAGHRTLLRDHSRERVVTSYIAMYETLTR